jgi:xanthine dehydrogenase accessory factor
MALKFTSFQSGPAQSDWPLYGLVEDIRPALVDLFAWGKSGALVTLVDAQGPSPRGLNAQMIIDGDGQAVGYVSGGCVEGSIALLAQDVIASGIAQSYVFGADSPFKDIVLMCGSQITVLIEPASHLDESLLAVLAAQAARNSYTRQSSTDQNGVCYYRTYPPTTRLMIFGADPVALASATLANAMGIETILIRENGPEDPPQIKGIAYSREGPELAFAHMPLDAWTAVVTTTHDLDQDNEVLKHALVSDAFYVGALGAARNRPTRETLLDRAGLTAAQIGRLHAPVGLSIGATGPFEIAVSILGDVIAALRQKG